jgi:hypothetical protein
MQSPILASYVTKRLNQRNVLPPTARTFMKVCDETAVNRLMIRPRIGHGETTAQKPNCPPKKCTIKPMMIVETLNRGCGAAETQVDGPRDGPRAVLPDTLGSDVAATAATEIRKPTSAGRVSVTNELACEVERGKEQQSNIGDSAR